MKKKAFAAAAAVSFVLLVTVWSLYFESDWGGPIEINDDRDVCEDQPTACLANGQVWMVYYGFTRDTRMNFLGYKACGIGEGGALSVKDAGYLEGRVTDEVPNSPSTFPTFHDDWPAITTDGERLWVFYRHIVRPDKRSRYYTLAYKTVLASAFYGDPGSPPEEKWINEIIIPTPADLTRVGTPSVTFIPGDPSQIWLAYTGRLEGGGKGKKGSFNNDIYLKRGIVQTDGIIVWNDEPDERRTSAPESEVAPAILYTGEEVWLVYQCDQEDEWQLYALQWTDEGWSEAEQVTGWSEAEQVTNYGSTDYMMYPQLGMDPNGKVWLYYEAKFPCVSAKYLDGGSWSNRIWVSDEEDHIGTPVPVYAKDSSGSEVYTYLIVRWYDYGNHLAYLQWKGDADGPIAPDYEVRILTAEYNSGKGVLSVVAECTTSTDLYVYGREEGGTDYRYLGPMAEDGTFDQAVGFIPRYVMVSTEIPSVGEFYSPSRYAGFDILRASLKGKPPGRGKK